MSDQNSFDYIIIGAGSAGCVLANRLSANPANRVLLLEAGGGDLSPWIQIPLGYGKTFYDPGVNWMYHTQPEQELHQREMYWPRGKVLGGSSAINAMVYMRGLPLDYQRWADAGNPGWDWDGVLPFFKRSEDFQHGSSAHHGVGGEWAVSDPRAEAHPLNQVFFDTVQQHGFRFSEDLNSADPEGVGYYHISTRNGWRASSANAFLRPALGRPNLEVRLHALVDKLLFSPGSADTAPTATGLSYRKYGQRYQVHATKAVMLTAGAVNTPHLLQLSGVGDPALLTQLGIPLVHANPNVGQHLQDHLSQTYTFTSKRPTLNNDLYPFSGKVKAAWQYLIKRNGLLSMSVNQAGGYVRSDPNQPAPNLQLYFNALTYRGVPKRGRLMNPDPFAGFSMTFNACRPSSRGQISLRSAEVSDKPLIQPNYLSTEHDVTEALAGCRLLRTLASTAPISELIIDEFIPGKQVQTDDELLDDFRERSNTVYHVSGTCRMGKDAMDSVVDPQLKVHGIDGLYVMDASVFPFVPSGNTNAPTIMVAEKGVAGVLGSFP